MAFEALTQKLNDIFKKLKGKGKLTEADVKQAMREVKLALLEADVNFKVVKDLIQKISERAVGQEVMESLTPGQQVIKIVNDELVQLMGSKEAKLNFSSGGITVIMLVGLQGSGKTTTAGKLGRLLSKSGKKPLLTAADIYRPAAIKQLQVVGEKLDLPVFTMGQQDPVNIARASVEYAHKHNNDVIIIDTAGRLHIDEELMDELSRIKQAVNPSEILLVVDSMTGQDAVNVAEEFNKRLALTGLILTKLDGDTRGGAALSVKAVTGCPIKFVGMGEKLENLEPFYPERMASRILGMGDVLTLIEKATQSFDLKKAQELEQKLKTQSFDLNDFLEQLSQVKKIGSLDQILSMIPGFSPQKLQGLELDEKELVHVEAIINSMTPEERKNPSIINGSRRKRIAAGSGTSIQDVNRLLKQYEQTRKMIKQMTDMEKGRKKGKHRFPFYGL
ncbi:signal recognition particle protein [Biomaibacter acetigenes]|jgi:signal recognition particle subunit SRP54|uniref:Signal recognition particle protein n=1 Tax=Biomaibacter acetigenes TaxID=2316383 RepID=A0A3G2R5R0_9FIRM|nr:signal recognition particle protein [Biomaibacter acetigenes]AYO30438.1 signal recognition particle protein [Biomaibacter acetigenes]MDN5300610.1 signal recognition particle subunit [Thermoanaerobacteraceae bacterium]MDN5313189.1 signal recognition particle subunit [Thermoanaerobacteraceae bacterium]RKL62889.1 signal recognition particle protein [Thermoanaerobacteraceae bacterium SP2]